MAKSLNKRILPLLISIVLLAFTSGCTEFWTSTVSRNRSLKSGEVMLTTADLRQTTRLGTITCAEPSPDVAKIAAAALDFSASGSAASAGGAVSPALAASLAASRSEALAQLGQRIATIQLLRDGMFRACEAYSNGAIDKSAYAAILSRYDKLMITMLLGEFAANSTTRILPVTLTSTSGSNGSANSAGGVPGPTSEGTATSETPAEGSEGTDTTTTGSTAKANSDAQSATTAQPILVLQESTDRPAVAAALATMQQAYIDDLNVDPLLLNCLRTNISDSSLELCKALAESSQVFSKYVDAKVLSVLMRAKAENDDTPTKETIAKIKELEEELKKLKGQ